MKFLSKNSEETLKKGEGLGRLLEVGMVVALEGDLGGGKTTFTKGLAKGLGITEDITSPSFSLEKIYPIANGNSPTTYDLRPKVLYHFDFYRIENPKDMMNYELVEALNDKEGVVVVEWAEKIEKDLPKEKITVKFHYLEDEERELEFLAFGEKYRDIFKNNEWGIKNME